MIIRIDEETVLLAVLCMFIGVVVFCVGVIAGQSTCGLF